MKRTHTYRCWQERMLDDMTLHGYAQKTQEVYLRAAERLSEFCAGRSPRSVTIEELRQFFIYLKTVKVYSRPTCTSFICAIKFLFEKTLKRRWPQETILVRPPRQSRLPVILTLEEVGKILREVREAHHRCCLGVIYSCGLRLGEGLSLKIEDIDAGRMVLHIRAGKGQKDRYVPLPERALLVLLMYEDQLAQVVSVAQPMAARVTEVWFPEVVNGASDEVGQNADSIEGLAAAFAMDLIVGRLCCRGRVKPPKFYFHA